MESEAPVTGALIKRMKKDIDKPLSAILTLNTIAHTVGAIGVGAQAGEVFGKHSIDIFGLKLSYESLVAAVMTLAILILSEIIPKTIGANNWKKLAPFTAKSLNILGYILKPFVWLSNLITKNLKKDKSKSVFGKQDFAAMADVINESGEITKDENVLIQNVLKFDELTAKDVMTPRTVAFMAQEDESISSFYEAKKPRAFSRIPIYSESKDTVTGVILKDDLMQKLLEGENDLKLKDIKRELFMVPGSVTLRKVFEDLNERQEHIAMVVDEYGGVMGLLTLEDIFETLFGFEIVDETDSITDPQKFARQKWEARARRMGLLEEGENAEKE